MARRVKQAYVDKNTRKIVEAGTNFKGSDERFNELKKLGFVEDVPTVDELRKEDIVKDLKDAGIKYNEKDTKENLFKLLHGEE